MTQSQQVLEFAEKYLAVRGWSFEHNIGFHIVGFASSLAAHLGEQKPVENGLEYLALETWAKDKNSVKYIANLCRAIAREEIARDKAGT